jgi:hypothetical protein
MMRGPNFLRQQAGHLKSDVGGAVPGSHATMRGLDLHAEFRDAVWMDVFVYGITGRRLSESQLRLLDLIWTYTSYPDSRLWNNRVAALAGTARSTGALAMAAALAASEASIFGGGVYFPAVSFIKNARQHIDSGGTMEQAVKEELKTRRGIAGYGRPLTSKDERLTPLLDQVHRLGLDQGSHLLLALDTDRYLNEARLRLRINYVGLTAALLADMGFSPRDYYLCEFPAFMAGMAPCYLDAVEKPEGALFPIPCEDIYYFGQGARSWPELRNANIRQGSDSGLAKE